MSSPECWQVRSRDIFINDKENNLGFNLYIVLQSSIAVLITNFRVTKSLKYELKRRYIEKEGIDINNVNLQTEEL